MQGEIWKHLCWIIGKGVCDEELAAGPWSYLVTLVEPGIRPYLVIVNNDPILCILGGIARGITDGISHSNHAFTDRDIALHVVCEVALCAIPIQIRCCIEASIR